MTNTPNNIAGEESRNANEAYVSNHGYVSCPHCNEPIAQIFREKEESARQEAIAGERKEFLKYLKNMDTQSDIAMRSRLKETIELYSSTPNPDTSKES